MLAWEDNNALLQYPTETPLTWVEEYDRLETTDFRLIDPHAAHARHDLVQHPVVDGVEAGEWRRIASDDEAPCQQQTVGGRQRAVADVNDTQLIPSYKTNT